MTRTVLFCAWGILLNCLWVGGSQAQGPDPSQTPIIYSRSVWSYFDSGADLGQSWRSNDVTVNWPGGEAPFGYGDTGLGTVIGPGTVPAPVTMYFRHWFNLADPSSVRSLTLRLMCDDGAIVYLNGTEIYRRNMPADPVDFRTGASVRVEGTAETNYVQYSVSPYLLQPGDNLMAVELHQHLGGLADARFDLELVPNRPLTLPEIRVTSPTNLQVLSSATILFQVDASDYDGFVYLVRYYVNGSFIGDTQTEPFSFLWSPAPTGRYRVTAEAVDNSGRRRQSAPVYFQVGAVAETSVVRGPYLQSGSSTGMVVRWRTDWPEQTWVRYGRNPDSLDRMAYGSAGIDHEVKLTGLSPETTYYYTVGDDERPLAGGFGPDFRFTTGSDRTRPLRVWAIGDSGTAGVAAAEVRDAYLQRSERTDVWLMLGDNAYESGTDEQYQRAVFQFYPQLLRNTVLWPTLGNHDSGTYGVTERFPYQEIFSLPRNGESGGVPSGSELYYSFNEANVHFVCLDGTSSDRSLGGPMLTWLENDLAATDKDWIIAFWHQPPYTWGTHTSDGEFDLTEIRQNIGPIVERYGVDLVLCGHSHVYERSYLLNGHYGHSSTLTPSMKVDAGSGSPLEGESYRRPAGGIGANQGTVYVVCGCSGEGGYFDFKLHPAMYYKRAGYGSLMIDVNGLRLDGRFLTDDTEIADWFVIDKRGPGPFVQPRLEIDHAGSGVDLTWPTAVPQFRLETRSTVGSQAPWLPVPGVPEQVGRTLRMHRDADGTNRIFRLKSTP